MKNFNNMDLEIRGNAIKSKDGKNYRLSQRPRIELNVLRPIVASLLNRGSDGQVKTIEYGGTTRSYISSQCLKHVIRNNFSDSKTYRTKHLPFLMKDIYANMDLSIEEINNINDFIVNTFSSGYKEDKNEKKAKKESKKESNPEVKKKLAIMNELHQFSGDELNKIYKFISDNLDDIKSGNLAESAKTELKKDLLFNTPPCIELAMFGRMETKDMPREVFGATGVSFTVSVDEYKYDIDDFTANDDICIMEDDSHDWKKTKGAGMIESVDICTNEMYGYATVDIGVLIDNLCLNRNLGDKNEQENVKKLAIEAVTKFVEDYITVMPTAHQHDKATHETPDCLYFTISNGTKNISYAKAFEKAVKPDFKHSISENAQIKLIDNITENKFDRLKYINKYFISDIELDENSKEKLNNKNIDSNSSLDEILENVANVINNIEFISEV